MIREEDDVRPANVELAKHDVETTVEVTEFEPMNVATQKCGQYDISIRVLGRDARTDRDLPIDEFQPNAGRIFSQLKILSRSHLDGADDGRLRFH
jgi:hypothetical protein